MTQKLFYGFIYPPNDITIIYCPELKMFYLENDNFKKQIEFKYTFTHVVPHSERLISKEIFIALRRTFSVEPLKQYAKLSDVCDVKDIVKWSYAQVETFIRHIHENEKNELKLLLDSWN